LANCCRFLLAAAFSKALAKHRDFLALDSPLLLGSFRLIPQTVPLFRIIANPKASWQLAPSVGWGTRGTRDTFSGNTN
jgi:hypothetical protein